MWIPSPWFEEKIDFQSSEMHHNEWFLLCFLGNSFTMVGENSDSQSCKMLQKEGFSLGFWANTFTMAEENFDSEKILNARFSLDFWVNTFTMVEEIFDYLWLWEDSKCMIFTRFLSQRHSLWLKKILISRALKCSRMKDFC